MKQKIESAIPGRNILRLASKIAYFAVCAWLLISCGSTKGLNTNYLYFRDGSDTVSVKQKESIIQPNDVLSIQVISVSLNQEQATIFNLPNNGNGDPRGYQVNGDGNIKIPVLGYVKAAGLTMDQLQNQLEQKLTSYVKNANVLVRFLRFSVVVIGEVKAPGTVKFSTEAVTVFDAIGAAGDLTDYGKREDVTVIREENGKKIYTTIDLRNKNLFESPVYFLQPNDIVYVGPNKSKLKNLNIDPEKQRRTSLFLSITGILLGIATLVITIIRN